MSTLARLAAVATCLWPLAGSCVAIADDDDRNTSPADDHSQEEPDPYDQIRKSVRDGKLLPLATIKADVQRRWAGEIVNVSIGREKSLIVYEFRILSPNGRLIEIEINAANGAVLEVENE
ncbi:hypothetical protein JJB09_08695 [Rhizobium sp. KVB221]|uniref:PepSY domain-containing protein n=1 Tax=Rhizobium setariae TaxID=2801340 RepID=A0A936YTE7_9HYPH|nr:PepSY domain-containing protein [Rhizobium setariae]MBL0372105.1 hypothetical protein [Rhizobium setariae]